MNESKQIELTREQEISRFLFNKREYSSSKEAVFYTAFLPFPRETSVMNCTDLGDDEIWETGEYVAEIRKRTLKARADLSVAVVIDNKLRVIEDNEGYQHHAGIIGWPNEEERRQMIALELAEEAILHIKP